MSIGLRRFGALVLVLAISGVAFAQPKDPAGFRSQGETQLVLDPQGFRSFVGSVAVSPDDRWVAAAAEKEIRLWDVKTGKAGPVLRGDQMKTSYGNVFSVAFSPDGRELVAGIDDYSDAGSIRVYDTANLTEIRQLLPGHGVPVRHAQFSRDGRYLASAGENGKIFLWDWPTKKHIRTIEPDNPKQPIYDVLMFPADSPLLFVMGFNGPAFYTIPDGRKLTPRDTIPQNVRQWLVNVTSNAVQYPAGSGREPPRLWHLPLFHNKWMAAGTGVVRGETEYWVAQWTGGQPAPTYRGHKWYVTALTLSRSGRVAASGDKLGDVHVWDPKTGQQLHRFTSAGFKYYDAALSDDASRLYFSKSNFSGSDFRTNHYGPTTHVFDLRKRALTALADPVPVPTEQLSAGPLSIKLLRERDVEYMTATLGGKALSRYRFRAGRTPRCYSVLARQDLGVPFAAVWGDEYGSVEVWNPESEELRRECIGHDGFVTSVGATPDGKLLVSSSTDRTLRLWSLGHHKPTGKFDFDYQNDLVIRVNPGSSAEKAGVHVGDRVIALDGKSITEITNLMLLGRFDYRPGQVIPAVMERNGKRYQYSMTLAEGPDFAEPLLSAFFTQEGEWILFTPRGYYDASPGADRFIGWHVNRGPDRSAEFYTVGQFRKQLYRPDIIDKVIETGSLEAAIRTANAESPRTREDVDLRQQVQMQKVKPPRVKILSPELGTETTEDRVTVTARVEPDNDRPVQKVTILLDGDPAKVIEPKSSGGPVEIREQIPLTPGMHDISIVASNGAATSRPVSTAVTLKPGKTPPAGTAPVRPDLYLLAIGVSEFAKNGSGINNLSYAAGDAQAFAEVIEKHRECSLYRKVASKLVLNKDATRAGILDGFDWLTKNVRQGDIAMIFVSSHGVLDSRQNFYLAGHDLDVEKVRSTGVSWEEITRILQEEFPPCKRLLFMDTCHAGGVTGSRTVFDPVQDLTVPEVGTIVFASSTPRELSLEDPAWKHGAFTKAILDMLADKSSDIIPRPNGDSLLETTELSLNIAERVKTLTNNQQHPVVHTPSNIPSFAVMRLLVAP